MTDEETKKLKEHHDKDVEEIKTRLTRLEFEFESVAKEIKAIRNDITDEAVVTKNLSDSLIRFEVSVNKINELSHNYYNLLTELQDMKITRSVDSMILKAVKFVAGGIVMIIIGIVFALIFTGTPKL